ncbi:MAG TPA: hypothetical protein VHN81_08070 [Edaphobacter sp.]|nr:hypothetical protein [Edaphobacter sp.]
MAWVLKNTLWAISGCERARSLMPEERPTLVMRHGATVELLMYQAEHGHREGNNALNR